MFVVFPFGVFEMLRTSLRLGLFSRFGFRACQWQRLVWPQYETGKFLQSPRATRVPGRFKEVLVGDRFHQRTQIGQRLLLRFGHFAASSQLSHVIQHFANHFFGAWLWRSWL